MSRNGTVRANPAKIASPKIHPAPQPPKAASSISSLAAGSQNNLSDAGGGTSTSKQPTWPATIPTRVKKLSWGDDSQNKVIITKNKNPKRKSIFAEGIGEIFRKVSIEDITELKPTEPNNNNNERENSVSSSESDDLPTDWDDWEDEVVYVYL